MPEVLEISKHFTEVQDYENKKIKLTCTEN